MIDNRKLFNIPSIVEYLLIAVCYVSAALVSAIAIKNSTLPFYFAITTGLMTGILMVKGAKSLIGFVVGAFIWQILTIFLTFHTLQLTSGYSFLYILSECITLLIFQKSLQPHSEVSSLIEQNKGLKRFFIFALISPIPQSAILAMILIKIGEVESTISFLKIFHLTWLSITASILSLTPFFISFFDKKNASIFKNFRFSWELTLFLFILFVPILLEITELIVPPYSFPIHYLVFPSILIIAFRKSIKILTLSLLVFYLFTIYNASTNHGIFFSTDLYLNASNIYYFVLFFLFISLIIGVVVIDRRKAFESLKTTYHVIEEEVSRQTSSFRELNSKLFEEIEQKGIIEKELSESRNLIEESQDIANIASWELNLDTEEIKWSKSAYKVIGFDQNSPPTSLSEYIKFIYKDDLDSFNQLFSKARNKPLTFETELRHHRLDGTLNYVLIRGRSFEENGKVNKVIGLSFDITKRKETEQQISEKEEKYRALFESNIDSVSVINPEDKTFVDVNRTFEQKYGFSKAEIIGKPYSLITAEVEDTHSAIDNAFKKGSHRVQSRIHKNSKGEEFFAEGIFVRFFALDKPLIFAMSHDITKRKIAEKNLAERELQYRLFFESDLIGMAETTPIKEWKTFNNKLLQILGYSEEELKQTTWDTITHPDDLKVELKLYNDVVFHKIDGYNTEKRFIRKDGSTIYCKVAVKAIINQQRKITHFVKLIEDISARKQIEKELLENRATLRRAQQIANLGSLSWNLSYAYITLNDVAYPLLGWKKSQGPFNVKNFLELVSPEKKALVEKSIEEAKNGKKHDDSIEVPIIINTGEIRYLLINIGFNTSNSDSVSEIVITIADITDIKKAEIALQEANALKDQLFSIIAHDLRGPIGSLNQMITYIADNNDSIDNQTRNEIIHSLKGSSLETYNLLENMLEWAKSQRQVPFKPELILQKPLIDESIALLAGMASTKNITITNSVEKDLYAFVDSYMVKTIFRNLISNAIKFTPSGGEIEIQGTNSSSGVVFKFIDSGTGIPKSIIDQLFNTSFNYTTPGTNNEKGTGLGLKLVKRLIEKNGGTIHIDSKPNEGSIFTVVLPVKPVD